MSRRFWTEDKIITEIQKLHKQGEDLWYRAMERNHKDLIRASERYYKGWKNAVVAAGLEYDNIKKRSHQVWTESKILKKLQELKIQGIVLRSGTIQKLDKKLYHATIRQFRNFGNALVKLNEKYDTMPKPEPAPKQESTPDMKIFTVRARVRSERNVGEAIMKRAEAKNVNIGAIQYPAMLNGYLFVECDDREKLNRLIRNIRNAQGLLNGDTTHEEITKYVKTKKTRKSMSEGTRVEITDGQFKGERAIIQHVNERTKELTVELMDEVFKMPILINRDQCKILS